MPKAYAAVVRKALILVSVACSAKHPDPTVGKLIESGLLKLNFIVIRGANESVHLLEGSAVVIRIAHGQHSGGKIAAGFSVICGGEENSSVFQSDQSVVVHTVISVLVYAKDRGGEGFALIRGTNEVRHT